MNRAPKPCVRAQSILRLTIQGSNYRCFERSWFVVPGPTVRRCCAEAFNSLSCCWLCPVGTLSEYLWRAGGKFFGRNFQLPRWLDLPLRSLKYLLLGFFAWAVANMSPDAISQFMHSPYGAIADVRMLNFFRDLEQ